MRIPSDYPQGTKPGHLQFATPGFKGDLGSGSSVAAVFSPRHPNFQQNLDGWLKHFAQKSDPGDLGTRLVANDILCGIYKHEDPTFQHPERAVEARKFFDRVNREIGLWARVTFEKKIISLREAESLAELSNSGPD